jgi:hypothetical protein
MTGIYDQRWSFFYTGGADIVSCLWLMEWAADESVSGTMSYDPIPVCDGSY